jgi:4-diphosphocytidyl-2-C-methyl-D-erythritol kinase
VSAVDRSCRVLAHAKLNLALRVLAREESGYHQIETIFCALELGDELDITLTQGDVTLTVTAPPEAPGEVPDLGPREANLAVRAARSFFESSGCAGGARIQLTKRVPAGAGLGGGSSDAAATLQALNRLHDAPLPRNRLLSLAGELGSDGPFFVAGAALSLGWGRGDRLAPLPPLPSASVLLAIPPERVVTADAYADLAASPDRARTPAGLLPIPHTWSDVERIAVNDFEQTVFARAPRLRELRELMHGLGAALARMTGTGSTIFGVFEDVRKADHARAVIEREHQDVTLLLTRTLEAV